MALPSQPSSAIDPATFLMRMLNNLKHVYLMSNQVEAALSVLRYMRATDRTRAADLRDEGLCLYALRRYAECAEAVEEYLEVGFLPLGGGRGGDGVMGGRWGTDLSLTRRLSSAAWASQSCRHLHACVQARLAMSPRRVL